MLMLDCCPPGSSHWAWPLELTTAVSVAQVTTSRAPVMVPLMVTSPLTNTSPAVNKLALKPLAQLLAFVPTLSTFAPVPDQVTTVWAGLPVVVRVMVTFTGDRELGSVPPVMKQP